MKAIETVLELLDQAGFEPDGETRSASIKTPIQSDRDPSGWSRKLTTIGGRQRFRWNDWRVTVGPRTVYFWLPIDGVRPSLTVSAAASFKTAEPDRIAAFLAALPAFDDNAESGDNDSDL